MEKIDFELMYEAAGRATQLLKVLSNTDRLILLCKIAEGECSVSELENMLDIKQPTLSQQLTVLREEGLVKTRREGKFIYYSISSSESLAIMNTLQEQFCSTNKKPACSPSS
ncbi:MAG: transcriptional regulator [Ferrovum sp. 37-45-19]|jgi:DNA-binding transcriptional ArsR family regulator|uniref:ArsR/SmtB family transcription factor n=1 Tax=Ferrovum sp. JA12 TaxID=1356299 RepID=UPI000702BA51|nr:metalloregulator ArsR/SmtB family transcription factor [Ferrovum sp. JA12]OYV78684.1 MAG: transcriptional regulator [Ferrovum sp. 21-44-67]OYV93249.1 MAG: transcriptional regulator [Ferrovum sp. 37-45-19]OZB33208.1 MAG: transcriptional regulator [Ferrovum sp. 34-44-207]HQT82364.1 metalloregulator ArsR/SmtB family transcription factor [Ferrovaceae bacterium]KRH79923.1 biofilm growth-associated repressor [Ferrovum sp. JA12]